MTRLNHRGAYWPIIAFAAITVLLVRPVASAHAATSYDQMTAALRADCAASPGTLHLYQIGSAAKSGRPIWMARVSAQSPDRRLQDSPRLMIICRQHGDEPVSTEAALQILHGFAAAAPSILSRALSKVTLYIIPMANPDGADSLRRENGVGADLNRDWSDGRFTQPESRAIYAAYKLIRPQVVADFHSWTATDPFQANSVEVVRSEDAPTLAAGTEAAKFQASVIQAARAQCGLSMTAFTYSQYADQTLCHRFFAQKGGVVSLLVETASGGVSQPEMQPRADLDAAVIRVLANTLEADYPAWRGIAPAGVALDAPASDYTASAQSFMDSASKARLQREGSLSSVQRTSIAAANHARLALRIRQVLPWALGVYVAACIVLARYLGPLAARAIGRMARSGAVLSVERPAGYVSVRRRHFPNSRNMAVIRHPGTRRSAA